jgi:hypothetical protein
MAGRSNTKFLKRQKELARAERQRDKAAKRDQRKAEKQERADSGDSGPPVEAIDPADLALDPDDSLFGEEQGAAH